jgi:hypothetical protein
VPYHSEFALINAGKIRNFVKNVIRLNLGIHQTRFGFFLLIEMYCVIEHIKKCCELVIMFLVYSNNYIRFDFAEQET